ncbi:putative succinyl-CoA ligase [ADP-forming] subunit alpha, mitochondrial [Scedosporium apiospermum]|uniref:Putative succinyl-CoA ligase [ADP-forming] subunit alpha, mitochondrial n=1 Tax=Pseudallescheria apiosperma TaxID=563466 RepID=A0A084G2Z9_PSEDA|nr:putative succinyl-CoA ligase [ADP-forming] subunit alpha, mitochondrial [Scedosporium apiospermum]KEZ41711.1 putative succinyl-CoA ligase [ADP-forming] subunit alpha, mitochondrial [Scedosporium apiospermum]
MAFQAARRASAAALRCTHSQHHRFFHLTSAKFQGLLIDETTRVLYQGFTGRAATNNAKDAIAHGTQVVGGVTPGKGGRSHLGLPAVKALKPDASFVHVPASAAARAIEEAIEAEIPLIVSIAEHIPVHDMLRVQQVLRTQSTSRLVGPNSPGMIAPGKCRIGIIPNEQCMPGSVGIISRSGTMIYEAVGATGRAGLGQSMVIGLGGDTMPGTTMKEALETLIQHNESRGIVLIGEVGGLFEIEAADAIKRYRQSSSNPKPIIAIVSGRTVPPGKVMGHAGALLSPGEQGAEAKARALQEAGVLVVPHLGMLESTLHTCFPLDR